MATEADKQLVFIHNPGQTGQTVSFINLLGTNGLTINGLPDDSAFPASASGYFLVAATGGNTVYKIVATNLAPGSVYVDVGDEFGILNLSTGVVTPIFTGTSPHGLAFVPTPEPSSLVSMLSDLAMCKVSGSSPEKLDQIVRFDSAALLNPARSVERRLDSALRQIQKGTLDVCP